LFLVLFGIGDTFERRRRRRRRLNISRMVEDSMPSIG
jgi:hypothetical protein